MSDLSIEWLRGLAEKGGKGVVNNIDARCLGRIADDLEKHRAEIAEAVKLLDALLGLEKGSGEAALAFVEKHSARPFYGAECPSYPNCAGGCGLGCTKEIERSKAPVVTSGDRS